MVVQLGNERVYIMWLCRTDKEERGETRWREILVGEIIVRWCC